MSVIAILQQPDNNHLGITQTMPNTFNILAVLLLIGCIIVLILLEKGQKWVVS